MTGLLFSCPECDELHPDEVNTVKCDECGSIIDTYDDTVLGKCPHGVDLDRDFCPDGCRV